MKALSNFEFYSDPSSPKQCVSPFEQSHASSTIDEFEFETSSRFDLNDVEFNLLDRIEHQNAEQPQIEEVLTPSMAFADELFSEGKLLPLLPRLKLKPPPGLECGTDNSRGKISTASSPRSPSSALKFKFVHQNLWNDDFDPFLVALQSVREEDGGKTQPNNRMRAQAYSPRPQPKEPMNDLKAHLKDGPEMLSEPKGLVFAIEVAKMDQKRSWPNMTTKSGPILNSNEDCRDGAGSYSRKRNKLVSLFRKFSFSHTPMRGERLE